MVNGRGTPSKMARHSSDPDLTFHCSSGQAVLQSLAESWHRNLCGCVDLQQPKMWAGIAGGDHPSQAG